MKRKVIRQGNQAYTLTLPIEWVRRNRISEASELDVSDAGKSLLINSSGIPDGGSVTLHADGWNERNINAHLAALYAKGADEVIFISKRDISSELIKNGGAMIGFALVEQDHERYVIRDVSGGNYPHLDEIFKRVFQIILLFYEAAAQDIFGKQQEKLETLKARDVEVNKFCLYLQRAINKMSYADAINGRILFTYSYALEKISDEVERAWRTNIKHNVLKTKALRELVELSKEVLEQAFDFYYRPMTSGLEAIYALRNTVREKSLLIPRLNSATTRFIRHIVKIAEDAADTSHLALMRKL
ncbi:MAG TPA: hypothetical protein VJK03_03955 [Candidatus Nanoarchaeia archaeon]|nr:hypothetical protein [Candidatus Nanoarchaeia archaeon]